MKFFNAIFILIPLLLLLPKDDTLITKPEVDREHLTIDNLEAIAKQDDKKVLIKLSASWCKPCKKLSKTLNGPKVSNYVSENFHVIDFDIQTKRPINYQGKTYSYIDNPDMGYHELAFKMLENRLSIPALLVLDSDLNKLELTRGSKDEEQLLDFFKTF